MTSTTSTTRKRSTKKRTSTEYGLVEGESRPAPNPARGDRSPRRFVAGAVMSEHVTTDRPPHTVDFCFGGLDESLTNLARAHAVVLPVPYDGTVSYMSGSRLGPRAILTASQSM